MSLEIFDQGIDQTLQAFITVSTYCMTYISVDEAKELGIKYNAEDVKMGLLKGVRFKNEFLNEEYSFIQQGIIDIASSWKLLGFKDNEFINEKDFNAMYMNYVNDKSNSQNVRK